MAILGKVRYNLRGEWSSTLAYLIDDMIYYKNRTYRCKVAHTNSVPPNATNWELLVSAFDDMGAWSAATAYKVGDVVTVDASPTTGASHPRTLSTTRPLNRSTATFICIADNTNQALPTAALGSNAYWQCVAEGNGNSSLKFGWPVNAGTVPAVGIYDTGESPGWSNTGTVNSVSAAARPVNDSIQAGGLGYAVRTGMYGSNLAYITRNGGYVSWGSGAYGNRGLGYDQQINDFVEISFPCNEWYEGVLPTPNGNPPKVIQACISYSAHMVLLNNGEIYCWGYGGHGQNGSGNNNSIAYPVRAGNNNNTTVLRGKKAIRIAMTNAGHQANTANSNYALMSDGTLWSWGYNGYGQLGLGDVTTRNVPTQITTSGLNGTVIDIWAAGCDYGNLYVLTSTGYMYSCGHNGEGQLGWNGVTASSTLGLVKIWGTGVTAVKKFVTNSRQSGNFCAVLDASNQLWTWGMNNYGQCGNDTTTNITTGPYSVAFNGSDVRNVWISGGEVPFLICTRTASLVPYSMGANNQFALGRITGTAAASAYRTHQNNGTLATTWDTYRLQPMYVETSTTSPYYGTLTNVVEVYTWNSSDGSQAVMLEQIDGTKYWIGNNAYGTPGFYYTSTIVDLARFCAGNVSNGLGKRLRYIPSNTTEAELGCVPIMQGTNRFAALWYDKQGTLYYSGDGGNIGANHRTDYTDAIMPYQANIAKMPGA